MAKDYVDSFEFRGERDKEYRSRDPNEYQADFVSPLTRKRALRQNENSHNNSNAQ